MNIGKANLLFKQGKISEALELYAQIPNTHPLYTQAQFNIELGKKRLLNCKSKDIATVPILLSNEAKPLVSVVMPVFNIAAYLDASIMSVLNQSYSNIELIIVNDASTDNGIDIIRMYESWDKRIKVIDLEFNTMGGAGIPSNIGVGKAKGEYIAYADSDDILDKFAIEKMVNCALKYDAEVVVADFANFNNETRVIDASYDKDNWKDLPVNQIFNPKEKPSVLRLSPVPWRKLYLRSFLRKNNIWFPEGDYFYEDNPLHWFVLTSAKRAVLLDYVVAYHRMGREGQTMGASSYKLIALLAHINSIRKHIEKHKLISFSQELVDFILRTRWIINRQQDELLRSVVAKRFYQELSRISFVGEHHFDPYKKIIASFRDSYKDIDLSIVIYNNKLLSINEILNKINIYDISYDVYIINKFSDDLSEVESKILNDVNIFIFNIDKNNLRVKNSLIFLTPGKYISFVDSDFDSLSGLMDAVKTAETNKYNIVYPNNFPRLDKFSCVIRANFLRDGNIFFSDLHSVSDCIYFWKSFLSTNNKIAIDGLINIYKDVDSTISIQEFIHGVSLFIDGQKKLFKTASGDSIKEILRMIANIISKEQKELDFEYWSIVYRQEFSEIICKIGATSQ